MVMPGWQAPVHQMIGVPAATAPSLGRMAQSWNRERRQPGLWSEFAFRSTSPASSSSWSTQTILSRWVLVSTQH